MPPPKRDFIGAPRPLGEAPVSDLTLPPFHSRPERSEGYDDFVKRLSANYACMVERHNLLVVALTELSQRLTLVESHEITPESIEAAAKQQPVLVKNTPLPRTLQEYCHHVASRTETRFDEHGFEITWCLECDLPIAEKGE
jgi:hypothetical protein